MYHDSRDMGDIQYLQAMLIDVLWRESLSAIHRRIHHRDVPALRELIADQEPELRNLIDIVLELQIGLSAEKFKYFLHLMPDLSRNSSTNLLLAIVENRSTDLLWEAIIQLGKQGEKKGLCRTKSNIFSALPNRFSPALKRCAFLVQTDLCSNRIATIF